MGSTFAFPIDYFADPEKFAAIGLGELYIGVPDGDPAFTPGDRIQAYIARQGDTDLAIPQPIELSAGGVPVYNGSPVTIKVLQEYSCAVLNQQGGQVYYSPLSGEEIAEIEAIKAKKSVIYCQTISDAQALTGLVEGQQIQVSEYNSGTGIGGGLIITKTGVVTPNNITTFSSSTSGLYLERDNVSYISYSMAGISNFTADNFTALQSAINLAASLLLPFYGHMFNYISIGGNLVLPDNSHLYFLKVKQLTLTASTRTLFKNSGTGNVKLIGCAVNRNGTADISDPQTYVDSAGVWMAGFADLHVADLEVFGDGQGTGAFFNGVTGKTVFEKIHIHDITWWSSTTPTTEKAAGFGFQAMSQFTVKDFRISNILSKEGTDTPRRFQTDGMDFGGCSRFTVRDGFIENVGEGIDVTGSDGNDHWNIKDVYAEDCGFVSFKVANGNRYGRITGCTSVRAGWQGIAIAGVASGLENAPGKMYIDHNQIYDTGANPEISGGSIEYSGIAIDNRDVVPATPDSVYIHDNIVIDRQSVKTMNWGVRLYEGQYEGQRIHVRDNDIQGYIDGDVSSRGTPSSFSTFVFSKMGTTGGFTHGTSGSWLAFSPNLEIYDGHDLFDAGVWTVKLGGLYEVQANIVWPFNATGSRGVRIKVNGTIVCSDFRPAVTEASNATSTSARTIVPLVAGDEIAVDYFQSAGTGFDVSNTGTFAQLSLLSAG